MGCHRLAICPFFNLEETEEELSSAKQGLVALYCEGEKKESCVRLAILHEFGSEFVPKNMMPNGLAFPGSDDSEWEQDVIKFKRDLFAR